MGARAVNVGEAIGRTRGQTMEHDTRRMTHTRTHADAARYDYASVGVRDPCVYDNTQQQRRCSLHVRAEREAAVDEYMSAWHAAT